MLQDIVVIWNIYREAHFWSLQQFIVTTAQSSC